MDEILNYEYLSKVDLMMECLEKDLLREYYLRIDDHDKDSNILKGLSINIYFKDREQMTPHAHLRDNNGEIEFEVSLIDWSIVNVKRPKNTDTDWSLYSSVRERFFNWISVRDNIEKMFKTWDRLNPDNLLEDYRDNQNISPELKKFLNVYHNPIKLDLFRKDIYGTLSSFFKDTKLKKSLFDLEWSEILKNIGLWEKYDLDHANKVILKTAEDAVKDAKIWFT